jgi:hypothetical protein
MQLKTFRLSDTRLSKVRQVCRLRPVGLLGDVGLMREPRPVIGPDTCFGLGPVEAALLRLE